MKELIDGPARGLSRPIEPKDPLVRSSPDLAPDLGHLSSFPPERKTGDPEGSPALSLLI